MPDKVSRQKPELKRASQPLRKRTQKESHAAVLRQNIVNINESNLQQTFLEQSMTTLVLFLLFLAQRSQHCSQLTPVLESSGRPVPRSVYSAKLTATPEQR